MNPKLLKDLCEIYTPSKVNDSYLTFVSKYKIKHFKELLDSTNHYEWFITREKVMDRYFSIYYLNKDIRKAYELI